MLMKTLEACMVRMLNLENLKSQVVFVKITKTKVLAAFGQLVDVIFGNREISDRNFGNESSRR